MLRSIAYFQAQGYPVILIQHMADATLGLAPFFNEGTEGVAIHPAILGAAPEAPIVIKHYADAFHQTELKCTLHKLGVAELYLCGMMTQNCVTHTALSLDALSYGKCSVITDACTTVDEMLHAIALHALMPRVNFCTSSEIKA